MKIQTGTWRAACVPKEMFASLSHLAPRQVVCCIVFIKTFLSLLLAYSSSSKSMFLHGLYLFSSALLRYCFALRKDALELRSYACKHVVAH